MRNLEYIWNINEQKLSPFKRWKIRMVKRGIIVTECIMKNNLMSYASALTYNCMLAAVPVLAIILLAAVVGLIAWLVVRSKKQKTTETI